MIIVAELAVVCPHEAWFESLHLN